MYNSCVCVYVLFVCLFVLIQDGKIRDVRRSASYVVEVVAYANKLQHTTTAKITRQVLKLLERMRNPFGFSLKLLAKDGGCW